MPSIVSEREDDVTLALGIAAPEPQVEPGHSLGRYVVIERIAAGGMGTVVRAYDPKLHREVALKRLRPETLDGLAEARLVREAQAMAQLNHPNVVAVYDIDVASDGVLLAMEYVRGQTLQRWLGEKPRPWLQIVAAMRAAGEGLAAAHAVGLVHRDFKPSNVLVAEHDSEDKPRIKVTDFGLARTLNGPDSLEPESAQPAVTLDSGYHPRALDPLLAPLTRADVVMGTPRYMAPEQHAGEVAGPAADQYAFCVALWEALVGAAPFVAAEFTELGNAKRRGPPPWPRTCELPSSITEAIVRGLAPSAEARWPSMRKLLDALAYDTAAPRRRLLGAGVVLAAVAGLAAAWSGRSPSLVCAGAAERLAGVWDDARSEQIRAAMLATNLPFAPDTATRIDERLDRYAAAWVEQHRDACEATTVRGESSSDVLDLRMACLHRARLELGAAVDVLASADAQTVERADKLLALPSLSRCADVDALLRDTPAPSDPQTAAEVELAREDLARAKSLTRAGKYEEAEALAVDLEGRAATIAYLPLEIDVALALAHVRRELGRFADAEGVLRPALQKALQARQLESAVQAAAQLGVNVGVDQRRHDEGIAFAEVALGLALGLGPGTRHEWSARASLAVTLMEKDELVRAEAEQRKVLELLQAMPEIESTDIATAHNNLAGVLFYQGRHAEAEAEFRAFLAIVEAVLGPEHPMAAMATGNLAAVLKAQGKYDEAEAMERATLAHRLRVLGPDHPDTAASHANLGHIHYHVGRHEQAETELRAAVELAERALGAKHPDVARWRGSLANVMRALGRDEEAIVELRRALAGLEETIGPEHSDVIVVRINLGIALFRSGEREAGVEEERRALVLAEKVLGPEHPNAASAAHYLGEFLYELGRIDEARDVLERAFELRSRPNTPNDQRAETAFALAEALWTDRSARGRARALAEESLALYVAISPAGAEAQAEVEHWLVEHPSPR